MHPVGRLLCSPKGRPTVKVLSWDFSSYIFGRVMDDKETLRLIDENIAWAHAIAGAYGASIRHVELKDIKQEAGIALCRAADTYDPSRKVPFRAYAHTCITNRLDSLYRAGEKQAHEQTTLDAPAIHDEAIDETPKNQIPSPEVDAAREAHRNEVRRALAHGMAQLTPNQRKILEARSQGESYQNLAVRLGSSRQAVQQSADRALAQMKTSVEAKGISGPMFMPKVDKSPRKSSGCAAVLLIIPVGLVIAWILAATLR
jgi:RNA polymerase sigma factor (sigma-70 family)